MINLYLLLLLRAPDTQPPSPYAATPTSIDSPAPKSDIDKIQDVCCAGVVVMPLIVSGSKAMNHPIRNAPGTSNTSAAINPCRNKRTYRSRPLDADQAPTTASTATRMTGAATSKAVIDR